MMFLVTPANRQEMVVAIPVLTLMVFCFGCTIQLNRSVPWNKPYRLSLLMPATGVTEPESGTEKSRYRFTMCVLL